MEQPTKTTVGELTLPPRRELSPEFTETFINEHGESFEIFYKDMDFNKIRPVKKYRDVNYTALQTWIDNLGEAIYNPITAKFYPDGVESTDGCHRRVIHHYTGIPTRVFGVKMSGRRPFTRTETSTVRRYLSKTKTVDSVKVENHFNTAHHPRKMREFLAARFYPTLFQIPDFYGGSPIDKAIRHGLPRGYSMEQICRSIPKHKWRWLIPDMIQEDMDIEDKTILDVGCSIGYHSMVLLERGAQHSTLNTNDKRQIQKIEHLKRQRLYNVDILQDQIQNIVKQLPRYDIVLVLNMFHHVLQQTPDSWWVFEELLNRGDNVYMTMGTTWDVIKEYDNDVEQAFTSNIPCKLTELGDTHYRGRKLYRVDKK